MSQFKSVAKAASLPPGNGRSVEVLGKQIALYNHDGEYYAYDDACPHRGAPLGAGHLEEDHIFCPLHGWSFEVTTGVCDTNPNCRLKSYRTRVVDGEVEVELD